jgi:hypothetical protein
LAANVLVVGLGVAMFEPWGFTAQVIGGASGGFLGVLGLKWLL